MKQSAREEPPKAPPTVEEIIEQIWAEFDVDHSGALSRSETRNFVKHLLGKLGEEPKIPEEEFNILFKDMDEDNNGTISKAEMNFFIRVARGEEPMPPRPEPVQE